MLEGKTFLGATGMPIWKIALVKTRFAVRVPEPVTVAAWMVRSLMICCVNLCLLAADYGFYACAATNWCSLECGEMKVASPKAPSSEERRGALGPDTAAKLVAAKLEVGVESGAGSGAFLSDDDYEKAGVKVAK